MKGEEEKSGERKKEEVRKKKMRQVRELGEETREKKKGKDLQRRDKEGGSEEELGKPPRAAPQMHCDLLQPATCPPAVIEHPHEGWR